VLTSSCVCSQAAADKFEAKKRERFDLFMRAFNHVSSKIDPIYKELTRSQQFPSGGKASLELQNSDVRHTSYCPLFA
jgi:structural maintenance of chromosome 1